MEVRASDQIDSTLNKGTVMGAPPFQVGGSQILKMLFISASGAQNVNRCAYFRAGGFQTATGLLISESNVSKLSQARSDTQTMFVHVGMSTCTRCFSNLDKFSGRPLSGRFEANRKRSTGQLSRSTGQSINRLSD